jgi:hypothetical protein
MTLSQPELEREAAATGFQVEPLEKVFRLLELLQSLRSHPFLKDRIVLKGGTALNLFLSDMPRLSVDLDFNYIGASDRDTMLEEKPTMQQAINAVCSRLGIRVMRVPGEHAGGKWRLSYNSVLGRTGTLELDLNYILRIPLWSIHAIDSKVFGAQKAKKIPILDIHELASGKLTALFARNAGRDLFDVWTLLSNPGINWPKIRLGFVVYGGGSRTDWRKVTIDDVRADPREIEQQLIPLLRRDLAPDRESIEKWTERLVRDCRHLLSDLLPLTANEIEFLRLLNDKGLIHPELLTSDEKLQTVITAQPGLQWKALNVRKYRELKMK